MGGTASTIGVFYLAVVIAGALISGGIAWSTLVRPRLRTDPAKLERRERLWLFVMVGILVAGLFSTIFFTPYGKSAGPGGQVVRVTAAQFAWTLEPSTVRANVAVEFDLTATDVNHAFGLYDEDDVLLLQVQVPPDHHQNAVYTFDKPGTYRILCLEYCGLGHHLMESTIEVTE